VGGWICPRNGKKSKAAKKAKITRCVPQVACTLCWAHGTPTNLPSNENQIHLEIFYPEGQFSEPSKKITTTQDHYEADSRPSEKLLLRWRKTEPKNLGGFFAKHLLKKNDITCQPYKTKIRPAEEKFTKPFKTNATRKFRPEKTSRFFEPFTINFKHGQQRKLTR
jgi:hypothetical protein